MPENVETNQFFMEISPGLFHFYFWTQEIDKKPNLSLVFIVFRTNCTFLRSFIAFLRFVVGFKISNFNLNISEIYCD